MVLLIPIPTHPDGNRAEILQRVRDMEGSPSSERVAAARSGND